MWEEDNERSDENSSMVHCEKIERPEDNKPVNSAVEQGIKSDVREPSSGRFGGKKISSAGLAQRPQFFAGDGWALGGGHMGGRGVAEGVRAQQGASPRCCSAPAVFVAFSGGGAVCVLSLGPPAMSPFASER